MKFFKHRPIDGYQTKISIINRRKAILTTAKYTFFGLIGLRLLWLQVFQKKNIQFYQIEIVLKNGKLQQREV